jgi:hypothetical protein
MCTSYIVRHRILYRKIRTYATSEEGRGRQDVRQGNQYKRDGGHEIWDAGVHLFTKILSVRDRTKIKKIKKDFSSLLGSTRTISGRVRGPMRLHWRGFLLGHDDPL